jgi:ATP-dependent RNA helicase RhlE
MTFEGLNLNPQLLKSVARCGFTVPTPIQEKAIPPAMLGRDVMGLAQTGTGKTAAFALPILQRLSQGPRGRVRALIVAPTRELASQINDTFRELAGNSKLRSMEIYGGVGMNPQIARLRQGVEIVVACPGRLLDHINNRYINLSNLEVLVLDEADRMFDMGFLPDIRRIVSHVPAKRQTMLFSATMPPDIRKLANEVLSSPAVVQVKFAAPADTVAHALYPVEHHLKTPLLIGLLAKTDTESVLVFTRTKHRAKKLSEHLSRAGHRSACLQGDMPQNKRQAALDGFKSGLYRILVATDIAARGIDVSRISHVINYDVPDTADAYTHRIGRTGRATRTGDAFTLITPEDTDMVRTIERIIGSRPERKKLEGFDYDMPAPAGTPASDRPMRGHEKPRVPAGRKPKGYQPKGFQPKGSDGPGHSRKSSRPEHRSGNRTGHHSGRDGRDYSSRPQAGR